MSQDAVGVRAAANTSVTAAGTGDNTAVTGVTIDRTTYFNPQFAVLSIHYTTTLAAGKIMTFKNVLLESSDASNMGSPTTLITWEDGTGTAIETDSGSGSTLTGTKRYKVHLGPAKRYIRVKYTPDLDASGTDTAALSSTLLLSESYKRPMV